MSRLARTSRPPRLPGSGAGRDLRPPGAQSARPPPRPPLSRALPSAAPSGAASPAAASGAEATPPFRPPRGRGRRRAQPLAGARGTASSSCAASSSSGPPTRLLAPPRGCGDWKPKVRGAGRGRDLPGPELSSSPAEDAPEPVSGLRPISHLLLRRCDRRRPALSRAGCQVSLGVPVCSTQRPYHPWSPCPLPSVLL